MLFDRGEVYELTRKDAAKWVADGTAEFVRGGDEMAIRGPRETATTRSSRTA